ncbi:hypothetical protein Si021_00784 [Streptococcus infantarius subsp. infantarius]|nr:hypothetical protein [Streptococcus infantarius subsp. infantarius]MCO4648145.1 hypothetical protein [Streptococcus infantarius subsp. infantarius]MCO4649628.1 hypothetical protein [Streptococcus infantarius subsp. infantarius]MCO4657463.1 hypothetical protein [Streptococcus infantarius subsp. infantarius]MCO4661031.1 hypothetical protein [Streptococcus infantarius subsp. infantarius]
MVSFQPCSLAGGALPFRIITLNWTPCRWKGWIMPPIMSRVFLISQISFSPILARKSIRSMSNCLPSMATMFPMPLKVITLSGVVEPSAFGMLSKVLTFEYEITKKKAFTDILSVLESVKYFV